MADQDSGLIWDHKTNRFFEFNDENGPIALGWTKWAEGGGDREWNRVPSMVSGQWAQEVGKREVRAGIYRQNRGFKPGDSYKVSVWANYTRGQGQPRVSVGVHPSGGNDPAQVEWGQPVLLETLHNPIRVEYQFQAGHHAQTIFLRVDFSGVSDGAVSLDQVQVELLTSRTPAAWMLDGSPPVEPPYIYGMHDAGAEYLFNQKNRQGWVVHVRYVGHDPQETAGERFSEWVDGHGVIVRLDYNGGTTIPAEPAKLEGFAERCANFVKNSMGCGIWVIGNELYLGGIHDERHYARCYWLCRERIKAERREARVIPAGMIHGDPEHFKRIIAYIQEVSPGEDCIDGFALHSYTQGLPGSLDTFGQYSDLMAQIPDSMKHLPVYMTEAGNGKVAYEDKNNNYVSTLFKHVHEWNQSGKQPIRSVNFYRWHAHDQWGIQYKPGMIEDFLTALETDYYWKQP